MTIRKTRVEKLEAVAGRRDGTYLVEVLPGETEEEAAARTEATGRLGRQALVVPAEAATSEEWERAGMAGTL